MRIIQIVALSSLALLALSNPAQAISGKTHWGYEGHAGPAHWGELSHDYHMCKDGHKQSPIDITNPRQAKLGKIKFSYQASPKNIVNNGHTIQVNMHKGSSISIAGKKYNLLQFHFHSPSEHTIDGKPADMVAHFVHKASDGQLGVVGVLINKGKANQVIDELWQNLPTGTGESHALSASINVQNLLPNSKAYYNYTGSLTTPPCTEGVNWLVLQNPLEVSAAQVKAFTDIISKNVRPVQPLHGRNVNASK